MCDYISLHTVNLILLHYVHVHVLSFLEFDVLPELKQLQVEPEFAALGTEEIIKNVREVLYKLIPSNLILTGSEMEVTYSEVRTGPCKSVPL